MLPTNKKIFEPYNLTNILLNKKKFYRKKNRQRNSTSFAQKRGHLHANSTREVASGERQYSCDDK